MFHRDLLSGTALAEVQTTNLTFDRGTEGSSCYFTGTMQLPGALKPFTVLVDENNSGIFHNALNYKVVTNGARNLVTVDYYWGANCDPNKKMSAMLIY